MVKEKINIEVGNKIKMLRTEKGYSQDDLARILHYGSGVSVHYWENGQRSVSSDALKKLSEIFKVSSDYLLGLTDRRFPIENPAFLDLFANSMRKKNILRDYLLTLGYNIDFMGNDKISLKYLNQEVEYQDGCLYERRIEINKNQLFDLEKSIEEFIEFKMEKLKKESKEVKLWEEDLNGRD